MIWGLVSERQDRNKEATAEVSSKWGNTQTIIGPALILRTRRWTETTPLGKLRAPVFEMPSFCPKVAGRRVVSMSNHGTVESLKFQFTD